MAWPNALRRALHNLWRPHSTRFVLLGNAFLLLVGLGELAFILSRPCVASDRLYSGECGQSVSGLAFVLAFKVAVSAVILIVQMQAKLKYAAQCQLPELTGKQPAAAASGPSGWAAASSADIFDGVVKATASSQAYLLWFLFSATLVSAAAFAVADLATTRSPEYQEFLAATCTVHSKWWEPCRVSWALKEALGISVGTIASAIEGIMAIVRLEMFGPIFAQAVQKKNIRWLHRCLRVHWFHAPTRMLTVVTFVIVFRIKMMMATRQEMTALTWISAVFFLIIPAVIAWSLDLGRLMSRRCYARVMHTEEVGQRPADVELANIHEPPRLSDSEVAVKTASEASSADISFSHRQALILFCTLGVMITVPVGSWVTVAVVWVGRVLSFGLLFGIRDAPCSFTELQEKGAAFGLLVHADELREALRVYLLGSTRHKSRLRKTRATYYRMDDTMAVSYRWNSTEVEICPGLHLNMSAWQLQELEKGITDSGCSYVWIDRLALPQKDCKLQTTLLARMMAIYATCKVTLALRSIETENNRYHQRAWTLQEYCTAQQLRIVTQTCQVPQTELSSVAGDEENVFANLREWTQARQATCRAYWLGGLSVGGDHFKEAMQRFSEMSPRVECQEAADKIRALYPMCFNTPCDNQRELAGLVREVGDLVTKRTSLSNLRLSSVAADQETMAATSVGGCLTCLDTPSGDYSPARSAWSS